MRVPFVDTIVVPSVLCLCHSDEQRHVLVKGDCVEVMRWGTRVWKEDVSQM